MMDNNTAREIRKEFFAYRNGIIADKLRHAGDPHSMIMGCLLVDVTAIAQRTREALRDDARLQALAQELWADTNSRECRLAAPMLYPASLMPLETAMQSRPSKLPTTCATSCCATCQRPTLCSVSSSPRTRPCSNTLVTACCSTCC